VIDERDTESPRYRLLPAVREVAAERLRGRGETERVARRHAEEYVALAEVGVKRLYGRSSARWLERLIRERTNFRGALRWSVGAGERELGWRLGAALWPLLLMRSRFAEGRRWLSELIELAPDGADADLGPAAAAPFAEVLTGAAYLAYHQADYAITKRCTERALEIRRRLQAGPETADNLNVLAVVARRRCDFATAHARLEQAMEISRSHRDYVRLADQLNSRGNVIRESAGDLAEAEDLQQESFAFYTRIGSERGCAMAQCDLAYILADRGRLDEARAHMGLSLDARRRLQDAQGKGQSLNGLGRIERRRGQLTTAIKLHEEALELFEGMSDRLRCAETREQLGMAWLRAGEAAKAQALLNAAEQVREAVGAPRPPALRAELDEAFLAASAVRTGLDRREIRDAFQPPRGGRAATRNPPC
jgi:tetratricopeptide (TPR) repeat protein